MGSTPVPPSALVAAVDDFLNHGRAKGWSAETVRYSYGYPLREVFLPWAVDHDITRPEQLDNRTLTQFSVHLFEHGGKHGALKRASVWTYAKAVKQLVSWLAEEGEIVGTVKLPTLERRMVEVLSTREVDQLENVAQTERDKVIVRVLADTALRRAELAGMKIGDLMEEGGRNFILVHGKGARDRHVPVQPSLARRIRKLVNGRPKTDRVFLALRQRADVYEPLTENGVTQLITGLGERAQLGKHVHPHMLRHSFATNALRGHMDSILVAQVLGHNSLQMLQRTYAHMTPDDAHVALMKVLTADEE